MKVRPGLKGHGLWPKLCVKVRRRVDYMKAWLGFLFAALCRHAAAAAPIEGYMATDPGDLVRQDLIVKLRPGLKCYGLCMARSYV